MKDTILLGSMIALIIGIVMAGLFYVYEQNTAFTFSQLENQKGGNKNSTLPDKGTTQFNEETDPFGLFGPNEMTYEITFSADWSEATHRNYYPSNAHLSAPVIWFGKNNPVFSLGSTASEGIEEMAEDGRTRKLKQELEALMSTNAISDFDIYNRIDAPGKATYQVVVKRDAPVVSLVSMIAPSPDWFVAIEGLSLLEDNRWRNQIDIATIALDAGTEWGEEFSISNEPTVPQGVISALTSIPSDRLKPFVYVRFKRIGYEDN